MKTRMIIAILWLYLPAGGGAAVVGDAQFAPDYSVSDELELELKAATFGQLSGYKVIATALYMDKKTSPLRVLEQDTPKRLVIAYMQRFTREELIRITREGVRDNVDAETLETVRSGLERLEMAYADVRENDRISATYVPGAGTAFYLNGTPLVTIEGPAFARAYFSIYFGPRPADPRVKRVLVRENY